MGKTLKPKKTNETMNIKIPPIPPMSPCTWMTSKEKFFYINSESPYLVLYTHANPYPQDDPHNEFYTFRGGKPNFVTPNQWYNIMHQTAGYACHHYYIYAKFLKPRKEMEPLLFQLLKKYNDSCIARNPNLETAKEYQNILKKYGLDANYDYTYLEEGFYPIDIDYIEKVTSERLPKDLQKLIKTPEKKQNKKDRQNWSFLHQVNFYLAVLGPNCD
jgi:thiol-disulfide isomerase/thioredoxin